PGCRARKPRPRPRRGALGNAPQPAKQNCGWPPWRALYRQSFVHPALLKAVEPPRVVHENFLRKFLPNVLPRAEGLDQFFLGGGIVVAVVRADHHVVLADAAGEIRYILVGLAGDEKIVVAKQLGAVLELRPVFEQTAQNVDHERRPARRRLDEADAQPGKFLGDAVGDEVT